MSEQTINLTDDQLSAFERMAKAQGTTIEKIIEKAIGSFFRPQVDSHLLTSQ